MYYIYLMKTITITIDAATLKGLDHFVASGSTSWKNRSEVVRQAIREFITRMDRAAEEKLERKIFRKHRARLNRQAAALVNEQAEP